MSGKRLLDIAALYNASRGVARKHITLRTRQLKVYNNTSTLTRAVRSQTDRITETVKAASFLASRLNENGPAWASEAQEHNASWQSPEDSNKLNNEATAYKNVRSKPLSADAARTMQRQSELQIPARTADALDEPSTDPLQEGHDEDSFYQRSKHISPALSSLPRIKIPKHLSDIQEGDIHLPRGTINSESYYNVRKAQNPEPIPSVQAISEQEQVPEGVNTDLFYSPRVARILGGNTQDQKHNDLELKGSMGTPIEQTSLADEKNQDTFNMRSSAPKEPTVLQPALASRTASSNSTMGEDPEIHELAHDISNETKAAPLKVGSPVTDRNHRS